MSSTGRGLARSPNDYYGTEPWLVDAILPHLPLSGRILDNSAGAGQIVSRLIHHGVDSGRIICIEINPELAKVCHSRCGVNVTVGDFLSPDYRPAFDCAVFNPPYGVKEQPGCTAFTFVKKSFELARPSNGTVAALLRLNWLEGAAKQEPERLAFLKAHPPDLYISHKRGRFGLNKKGKLGGDSCAYAWMCWGPGRVGRVQWLDLPDGGGDE